MSGVSVRRRRRWVPFYPLSPRRTEGYWDRPGSSAFNATKGMRRKWEQRIFTEALRCVSSI